jgi:hypothetical protein
VATEVRAVGGGRVVGKQIKFQHASIVRQAFWKGRKPDRNRDAEAGC